MCPPSESILPGFEEFLRDAPKAELHVHLRGAMPAEFFAELISKYGPRQALEHAPRRHLDAFNRCDNIRPFLASPNAERVQGLFRYHSFDQFLATYLFTSYFVRDIDDFRNLIAAVRGFLEKQNIVYAEITVSVFEYLNQGIALPDLLAVLDETANAPGIRVQWIADLIRNLGPAKVVELMRQILGKRPASLTGITLGGSEHQFPPAQFSALYRLAREQGLRLSVHAGEALGPASVWDAIRVLQVDRIGHGVRAIEDPNLVDYLANRQIPLEVCPTSNLRTGVFPSYEAHPLKALCEAGVQLSVNTDDPAFFSTTLAEEYGHALRMGLDEQALVSIMKNGFRHAFLPEADRCRYVEQLDRRWQAFQRPMSS